MLAKQLIYFAGAPAAGLVLGARVPIVLTSRRILNRADRIGCVGEAGRGAARSERAAVVMSADLLLTFNAGSSTVKISLFEGYRGRRPADRTWRDRLPQDSAELPRYERTSKPSRSISRPKPPRIS